MYETHKSSCADNSSMAMPQITYKEKLLVDYKWQLPHRIDSHPGPTLIPVCAGLTRRTSPLGLSLVSAARTPPSATQTSLSDNLRRLRGALISTPPPVSTIPRTPFLSPSPTLATSTVTKFPSCTWASLTQRASHLRV